MKEQAPYNDSKPLEGAYHIARLIALYIQGKLSTKEHDELDEWVAASDKNMKLFEELTDEAQIEKTLEWYRKIDEEAALQKVKERIGLAPKKQFAGRRLLLYAALFLVIAGAGVFIYYKNIDSRPAVIVQNDVAPGSNQAVLTLGDGRKIILDSAGRGVLSDDGGVRIMQQNGEVAYSFQPSAVSSQPVYNTISVPRGGQYKIILSDGSAVWLNSGSSLKYPVVFGDRREVELEGEGYFEVRPSTNNVSFSVNMNGARVEVLGTHFNVRSYESEERRVTLVEGKVRVEVAGSSDQVPGVSRELLLGEEAVIGDGTIKVGKVDTDEALAWTRGRFYFRDATIKTIMQQLERWYDVETVYEDVIGYHFNVPDVPRDMPLSGVLKVLELTKKVRFEVEGRKVKVRAGI